MPTTKPDDRRRPERVASSVKEELATALRRDLDDPRLASVVLAHVHVTDDLQQAHISVTVLGDDPKGTRAHAACKVLRALEGGLRKRLAARLSLRRVPALHFEVDSGRDEASRLDGLLAEVAMDLKPGGGEGKR
ncbi:MAG: 30S ribosome-binding factor RbfA [Deltaproteobacteria bacterium]